MILSIIVAAAEDNAMGKDNHLPWHLPADMKFFKQTTMGKPVLMGRRTYESLDKPLPGRMNIVVSTRPLSLPEGVLLYHDLEPAIQRLQEDPAEEGFIIGGAAIFEQALPQVQRMYITRVHTKMPDADTFFPEVDHSHWKLVWEEAHEADEKHLYSFTFQKWELVSL